jgi:uncharacterized protein YdhG (YjbR/CyaY superfamily)
MAKSSAPSTPPATVDEYIVRATEPARSMLAQMRAAIRAALPKQAVEVISYRMPAFKLNKVLVWYAAFKDHCSLFPTGQVIDQFRSELAAYKISKGTVQFPMDKPLPVALIKKLAKARLQMVEEQPARRKRSS